MHFPVFFKAIWRLPVLMFNVWDPKIQNGEPLLKNLGFKYSTYFIFGINTAKQRLNKKTQLESDSHQQPDLSRSFSIMYHRAYFVFAFLQAIYFSEYRRKDFMGGILERGVSIRN